MIDLNSLTYAELTALPDEVREPVQHALLSRYYAIVSAVRSTNYALVEKLFTEAIELYEKGDISAADVDAQGGISTEELKGITGSDDPLVVSRFMLAALHELRDTARRLSGLCNLYFPNSNPAPTAEA
jgi:hypothetical protein